MRLDNFVQVQLTFKILTITGNSCVGSILFFMFQFGIGHVELKSCFYVFEISLNSKRVFLFYYFQKFMNMY